MFLFYFDVFCLCVLQMMEMTNDLNNKEDEARLLRQGLSTALDEVASLKVSCTDTCDVDIIAIIQQHTSG